MAQRVGECNPKPVMGLSAKVQRSAGLQAEPTSQQHKGNIVMAVAVALAQFVGPNEGGVIEKRSIATGFGSRLQFPGKRSELFTEPDVYFHQLFLRPGIQIRIMGERMMVIVNSQLLHTGLAHGVGVLNGGDPGEIIGQGIH